MLLNLDDNNSFVSTILILTLPLPMFFYLLNFIVKYLKNESIEYKDYYLYNDYVVERVNMYRIAYTLIVNYFIRNYCIINISIIIKGFIAIILILFTICILYLILRTNKPVGSRVDPLSAYGGDSGGRKLDLSGRSEPLALKSVLDTTSAAYIASFIALTPFLQEGINKGFIDFYNNKCDPSKNYDWKKIPFTKPGVLKLGRMGRTVNFMESDKHERYYLQNQKRQLDRDYLLDHYKPILDKSPIINMT